MKIFPYVVDVKIQADKDGLTLSSSLICNWWLWKIGAFNNSCSHPMDSRHHHALISMSPPVSSMCLALSWSTMGCLALGVYTVGSIASEMTGCSTEC